MVLDTDGHITVKGKGFRGSKSLWELLKRNKVNRQRVTSDNLRTNKKILLMTNAHFDGHQPKGAINVTEGKMLCEFFATIFARLKSRGVESALRRAWKKY